MGRGNKDMVKEWHSTNIQFLYDFNTLEDKVEAYKRKKKSEGFKPPDDEMEIWGFTHLIKDMLGDVGFKVEQGHDLMEPKHYIIVLK